MEWEEKDAHATRLKDYDLATAFEYNGGQPIELGDIAAVEASWTDGRDEPEFCWLLRLNDGRWAVGSGGHDYTGWDCQSSLTVTVWPTREEAIALGMTLNERCSLNLLLPGESMAPPQEE